MGRALLVLLAKTSEICSTSEWGAEADTDMDPASAAASGLSRVMAKSPRERATDSKERGVNAGTPRICMVLKVQGWQRSCVRVVATTALPPTVHDFVHSPHRKV